MDISIATIEWEKGSLVALQLILLPLVFKTEKNCSTTPKLPKSINSNSLFLVIHQFRRKSCFSCVFSFSFSLCLSIYSCALSGTPSTFFGFWRTTTSFGVCVCSFLGDQSPQSVNGCGNDDDNLHGSHLLNNINFTIIAGRMTFPCEMPHFATIIASLAELLNHYFESFLLLVSSWNSTLICFPERRVWS